MSLCEIDDLRTYIDVRHGIVRAVDGVSLSIAAGETVGLVGESGSGKTMTGMSIMRLLPPGGRIAGGSIRFDGRDLASASAAEMRQVRGGEIGMIFQDPMTSLDPTMAVGRQVAETWHLHRGGTRAEARAEAIEVLDLVGIPRPAERYASFPHQLSGGLRQRVMIAMALVCRPKLLIADEPTTALDVTIQAQILDLLAELKSQLGMAILLITHDMGVVANHADRVAVMYAGEIVESAGTAALFNRTRHRYSEALLASIPRLSQDRSERLRSIGGLPPDLSTAPPGCRFAPRCSHADATCSAEPPILEGQVGGHRFACFHPAPAPTGATRATTRGDGAAATEAAGSVPLMSCMHLSKVFPIGGGLGRRRRGAVQAVSDVSLDIAAGETFGLVGESGCGKTTLGHLIVGLEQPSSGTMAYQGRDIADLGRRERATVRRDLQLMFQDPYSSLDPRMRVGAIVAEPLVAQGLGDRGERRERVARLLDQVGLPARAADRFPHEFSGGQRQRIGLARSLALSPKLIVADEPVSALDVSIRSQILNLMRELQQDQRLTYLIISHDLSVVRYMADRIGVMYLGKLVEIGRGEDIYERPAHPYTAGLLAAIPDPEPDRAALTSVTAVRGELPSAADPPSGCRYRTRCPLAQDVCAAVEPPMSVVAGEHRVACHFPLQNLTAAIAHTPDRSNA
jgi:peptide/nickel transport system ATP-binding protein